MTSLVGRRVSIPAVDHPYCGEKGLVIDQQPHCGFCEYDELVVELESGGTTTVYEPEADLSLMD